ncbi:hypothetical protein [Idiomarina xiamenensis]|uniref:EF-hand domain-containing protein n=1 Tax=Idiomarina xiamenensis 10-D-4 TaxID=740709 RepID=K2KSR1_9GAMM|nr:hypothetical protein [Idiomarina xiamenensis]EKE80640.1 hypothetical protein A10D4_11796 [Idiomarina xiamenensis 10-D-4]
MSSVSHQWRFFRAGGFDQVLIETAADLQHLHELDPKLWTVLNCPTEGLEFDSRTLSLMDDNNDGYVRVPEVLASVNWCRERLTDLQVMFAEPGLPLANIATQDELGQSLLASAQRVLRYLDSEQCERLQVNDFSDMTRLYAAEHFNGDGVIVAALTDDAALQTLIGDIVGCLGGRADRSGEMGIDAAQLADFFTQAQAIVDWHDESQQDDQNLMPLAEKTAAAAAALSQVEAKIDDYFVRCGLAAYDPRAAESLNPDASVYSDMRTRAIARGEEALAALPIAAVNEQPELPLQAGINPAWAGAMSSFVEQAVMSLLDDIKPSDALTLSQWQTVKARLKPYQEWLARRPDSPLHDLGVARLRDILQAQQQPALQALIERDLAITQFADDVQALEKLTRLQRDLVKLLRNFVSLSDFYLDREEAIFQAGTLYIDQRSCELVLRVDNLKQHQLMSPYSGCYLLYCQCSRQGEKPLQIVAALTGGDVDYSMMPGRNGVFYDRKGRDWHATVTKVVAQPISVRQAFWTPYRRVATFVETQMNKMAAERDKDVAKQTSNQVSTATTASKTDSGNSQFDIAKFAGIFAAIGLAIGAIGSTLAAIAAGFFALNWWQTPLAIAGVLLLISGPSMVMAWLTLRRRNLGPLLDANGWAINTRALINSRFGAALTGLARLPHGAKRRLRDPYANKHRVWWLLGLLLLSLLYTLHVYSVY